MLEARLGNTRSSGPEIKQRVKLMLDSAPLFMLTSNTTAALRYLVWYLVWTQKRNEWNRQRVSADDAQNRMCFSSSATHLSSVRGGENPHDPSALFHVPEKPESRHLVGLRGHVHIDKQGGKLAGVAWDKGEGGGRWTLREKQPAKK